MVSIRAEVGAKGVENIISNDYRQIHRHKQHQHRFLAPRGRLFFSQAFHDPLHSRSLSAASAAGLLIITIYLAKYRKKGAAPPLLRVTPVGSSSES